MRLQIGDKVKLRPSKSPDQLHFMSSVARKNYLCFDFDILVVSLHHTTPAGQARNWFAPYMKSFPESATFVLFQRLHILLRWPAVFIKEFFVFFDDRVKLLSNPLKILEVKGYKMEAALGQLLSIEYLEGESKIVMNKLISCTIQKSCTGEGQGTAGRVPNSSKVYMPNSNLGSI